MLFGQLGKAKQLTALQAAPKGIRKVVLATNIAETSLTIADISVVVDSGLENVASFNLARNMSQLDTRRICKASSIQRAGRAGRIMAGHCYRLWSQEQQQRLVEHRSPAILQLDLSDLLLNTKLWGAQINQLKLLDPPTQAQIDHATDTLMQLGALDEQGSLSSKGRALSEFGCHPRWANVLLEGKQKDTRFRQMAALLVALHESNSRLATSPLLEQHLRLLNQDRHHPIWKQAKRWAKQLGCTLPVPMIIDDMHGVIAHLLLNAYPEHLAKRRSNGGYQLANGNGANWLAKDQGECDSAWLVITQLMAGNQGDSQIRLAHPVDEKWVLSAFAEKIEIRQKVFWHPQKQSVAARIVECLGNIELSSRTASVNDPEQSKTVILEQVRQQGLAIMAWPESVWQWIARLNLANELFPDEWPQVSESGLLDTLESWLAPYLDNVSSLKQLQQLNGLEILNQHWLTWQQQSELKQLLPSHFVSATGKSHPLDYQGQRVTLSIRIQEVYGLSQTPCIARGKVPLQLSLLSPAGRPIQTTGDLGSFWQGSYKEVQKEMKGRYPKHFWPDDPARAQATSSVKKKQQ